MGAVAHPIRDSETHLTSHLTIPDTVVHVRGVVLAASNSQNESLRCAVKAEVRIKIDNVVPGYEKSFSFDVNFIIIDARRSRTAGTQ